MTREVIASVCTDPAAARQLRAPERTISRMVMILRMSTIASSLLGPHYLRDPAAFRDPGRKLVDLVDLVLRRIQIVQESGRVWRGSLRRIGSRRTALDEHCARRDRH